MITNPELWAVIEPRLEGLKGSGANLEAKCPIHEHKTGKPFSISPSKGVWNCHGHREGGTLYQLAQKMGCLPVTRVTTPWGLDAAMRRYGIRVHERGVIFPVRDHEGHRCRDHVRLHGGEPRFQYWGKGRTYHALVDWPLLREWGKGCGIAYMVEGNRDWLALAAHDWPAIGILGLQHFAKAREEAFTHVRAAGIGCVVITPDNDDQGVQAAAEWAQVLSSDGFLVGVRRLPVEVNGETVKDTFDLFRATGAEFESALLDLPIAWRGSS